MRYVALILGIAALALGIASFVPAALVGGLLFGVIAVSAEMGLGLLAVGALGIMAGLTQPHELAPPRPAGHDLREWLA
ncbi:MAG TPA: hypothetical protein VGI57_07250 [Usitatibacter sp.]|jgi:hypothetical protein